MSCEYHGIVPHPYCDSCSADSRKKIQDDINELCIKFAKEQTRANLLEEKIKIATDALEGIKTRIETKPHTKDIAALRALNISIQALAKIKEMG